MSFWRMLDWRGVRPAFGGGAGRAAGIAFVGAVSGFPVAVGRLCCGGFVFVAVVGGSSSGPLLFGRCPPFASSNAFLSLFFSFNVFRFSNLSFLSFLSFLPSSLPLCSSSSPFTGTTAPSSAFISFFLRLLSRSSPFPTALIAGLFSICFSHSSAKLSPVTSTPPAFRGPRFRFFVTSTGASGLSLTSAFLAFLLSLEVGSLCVSSVSAGTDQPGTANILVAGRR